MLLVACCVLPPAFVVIFAVSLSLPAHRGGVEQRPASPLEWARKAWSHLNFFAHVGVPPGAKEWDAVLCLAVAGGARWRLRGITELLDRCEVRSAGG